MSYGQEGIARRVLESEAGLRVTAEDLASLADYWMHPTVRDPAGELTARAKWYRVEPPLLADLLDAAEKSLSLLRTPADLEPAALDSMRLDLLETLLRVAAYAPPRPRPASGRHLRHLERAAEARGVLVDGDRSDRGPGPA